MQVLDFVVQGLKHVPEQRLFKFGKGHNVLLDQGPIAAERLPILAEALRGLLSLDMDQARAAWLMDPAQPACRLGTTLKAGDGQIFRLSRDLKAGGYALSRANGPGFDVVATAPAEIARHLATLGMPPRDAFLKLFAFVPGAPTPAHPGTAMPPGPARNDPYGETMAAPASPRVPTNPGGQPVLNPNPLAGWAGAAPAAGVGGHRPNTNPPWNPAAPGAPTTTPSPMPAWGNPPSNPGVRMPTNPPFPGAPPAGPSAAPPPGAPPMWPNPPSNPGVRVPTNPPFPGPAAAPPPGAPPMWGNPPSNPGVRVPTNPPFAGAPGMLPPVNPNPMAGWPVSSPKLAPVPTAAPLPPAMVPSGRGPALPPGPGVLPMPGTPPAPASPAAPPFIGPGAAPGAPVPPEVAEKQTRLKHLRSLLKAVQDQASVEFELDGLQRSRFELDEKMRPLMEARARLDEARQELVSYENLKSLPRDFVRQLDSFERHKAALAEELRKIDEQARLTLQQAQNMQIIPPWKNQLFQGGLAGSILFLAVAGAGFANGMASLRYAGFLHLVGLGLVAYSIIRWLADLEERAETESAAGASKERRSKAQRHFELETSGIRRLLAELEVRDAKAMEELRERLATYEEVKARVMAADEKLQSIKQALGPGVTDEDYARLAERQAELEAKLANASFLGNEREMKAEVAQLEQDLARWGVSTDEGDGGTGYDRGYGGPGGGGSGGQRASGTDGTDEPHAVGEPDQDPCAWLAAPGPGGGPFVSGGSGPHGAMGGAPPPAHAPDGVMTLMKVGSELLGMPIPQLTGQIQARVVQYLAAFTDRRLSQVRFNEQGDVATAEASGPWTIYANMNGRDQESVQLSVRLAVIEETVKRKPVPVVIEGWFVSVPDLKHPLVAKMLLFLGSVTQLVHFSSKPGLAEGAETSVTL